MLRDWLLTLLVLTPMFLALLIILLALVGRAARQARAGARAAHDDPTQDGVA